MRTRLGKMKNFKRIMRKIGLILIVMALTVALIAKALVLTGTLRVTNPEADPINYAALLAIIGIVVLAVSTPNDPKAD